MAEAKLRENHARLEFYEQEIGLLLKEFSEMRKDVKNIDSKVNLIGKEVNGLENDVDYEKKAIDSAEELTFQVALKHDKNFEEIKNELNQLIDHQAHHNIQKELAVIYSFDKILNSRHLKILTNLLSKYNNLKKEFLYSNFNKITNETKIWRNDLKRLLVELINKGLIEEKLEGQKHEYRINPKLKKEEIKTVEKEMEKELCEHNTNDEEIR